MISNAQILDLTDCTRARQTLLGGPPKIVGLTAFGVAGLMAAALVWAAWFEVDIVVKSPGIVRPLERAVSVQVALAGKVRRAHVEPGRRVKAGDLLVELETQRTRADLTRTEQALAGGARELAKLALLGRTLRAEQTIASRRADSEIQTAIAHHRVKQAEAKAAATEIDRAGVKVVEASKQLTRQQELARGQAATEALAVKRAEGLAGDARTRLRRKETLAGQRLISASELDRMRSEARDAARDLEAARLKLTQGKLAAAVAQGKLEDALRQAQLALTQARSRLEVAKAGVTLAASKVTAARQSRAAVAQQFTARLAEQAIRLSTRKSENARLAESIKLLRYELDQATLRAPIDGVITEGELRSGEVLTSGQVVARIAPAGGLRFEVSVPNADVANLAVGQQALIQLEAYPHQKYGMLAGKLVYLSPDSATQQGGGQVFTARIEVPRGAFGPRGARPELGMTGTARISTERERLIWLIFRKLKDRLDPR